MTKRAVALCVKTEATMCLTDRASTAQDLWKNNLSMSVKAQNIRSPGQQLSFEKQPFQ